MEVEKQEKKLSETKQANQDLKRGKENFLRTSKKTGIMIYEGWEGIRNVYVEVLAEAVKTKQDILAIESNINNTDLGEGFLEMYIENRIKHKIKALVVCPCTSQDMEYKKIYKSKYTYVKLLKNFPIDANINIVGDLVMTFSTNPPQGTLHRSRAEAQTWCEVFKKLWREKKAD